MNGFDLLLLAVACATTAIVLLPVLAWLRLRAVERGLTTLESQFAVYAESSVRVAAYVSSATPHIASANGAESSRRALVHQARQALAAGEQLDRCASRLELRHDELKLMAAASRSMQAA
jgi:hypothetical protein